jgi:hypothetical protein
LAVTTGGAVFRFFVGGWLGRMPDQRTPPSEPARLLGANLPEFGRVRADIGIAKASAHLPFYDVGSHQWMPLSELKIV